MARVVYSGVGMSDPQSRADEIRNLVEEHEPARRVGLEVLWASGTSGALTLRARHHDRVLTVERSAEWLTADPASLAMELSRELVTEALGTERPHVPPPLWRRTVPTAPPAS